MGHNCIKSKSVVEDDSDDDNFVLHGSTLNANRENNNGCSEDCSTSKKMISCRSNDQLLGCPESRHIRMSEGSAYVWLRFSWANPRLQAYPLDPLVAEEARRGGREEGGGKRIPLPTSLPSPTHNDTNRTTTTTTNNNAGNLPPGQTAVIGSGESIRAVRLDVGERFIRRPGEVRGCNVEISENIECAIHILDLCGSVSIDHCERCIIFIGAAKGTVVMDNCSECVLVAACSGLQVNHCARLILSLCTPSPPVLIGSSDVGVTSLSGWFAYNEMPTHLRAAQLSLFNNNYSTVRDMTPPLKPAATAQSEGAADAAVQQQRQNGNGVPTPRKLSAEQNNTNNHKRPSVVAVEAPRNFFYLDPWHFDLVFWQRVVADELFVSVVAASRIKNTAIRGKGTTALTTLPEDSVISQTRATTEWADTDSLFSILTAEDVNIATRSRRSSKPEADRSWTPRPQGAPLPSSPLESNKTKKKGATGGPSPEATMHEVLLWGILHSVPLGWLRASAPPAVTQPVTPQSTFSSFNHVDVKVEEDNDDDEDNDDGDGEKPATRRVLKKPAAIAKPAPPPTVTPPPSPPPNPNSLPLSPKNIDDVFRLYRTAMVSPTTFGAAIIPAEFFKERWRLRLFIVSNNHNGWNIAQRVALDIERARRDAFLTHNKSPFFFFPQQQASSSWTQTGSKSSAPTGDDTSSLFAHGATTFAQHTRRLPLAHRCGPVLLLNTVELRCTETVMQELLAPTFYKLTEPPMPTTSVAAAASAAPTPATSNGVLLHDVDMRREFGAALERMSGQACVLMLGLTAPPGDASSEAVTQIFQPAVSAAAGTNFSGGEGSRELPSGGAGEEEGEASSWAKAVILNVSVPLRHVSLLQGNVFFKGSLTGLGHVPN